MGMFALLLGVFWLAQAVVAVIFKHGSTTVARWMPCFVMGNVIGISSTWIWMMLVKQRNANVVTGLAIGGAFLAQQVTLIIVYRGHLSPMQIVGIAAIVVGVFLLGLGARG